MISLRAALIGDCDCLYRWRNDPETIRNSLSQQGVPFPEHVRWFARTIRSKRQKIVIAQSVGEPVGMVRFDYMGADKAMVSWMIAPEHRGRGYGKTMLEGAIDLEPDKELLAVIMQHNSASKKMAERCGFRYNANDVWKIGKRRASSPAIFFSV